MTYRELLQGLLKLSHEQLEQDVLILSDFQPSIELGENGEIDNELSFSIAENDMYKFPLGGGPCGMCWDGKTYRPAMEVAEDLVSSDFVKCYDKGTPYISIRTI